MFITIITGNHRHMTVHVDHIVSIEDIDERSGLAVDSEANLTLITTTARTIYSAQEKSVILKMIEDARAEHLESTARVFEYALDKVLSAQTVRQFGG